MTVIHIVPHMAASHDPGSTGAGEDRHMDSIQAGRTHKLGK